MQRKETLTVTYICDYCGSPFNSEGGCSIHERCCKEVQSIYKYVTDRSNIARLTAVDINDYLNMVEAIFKDVLHANVSIDRTNCYYADEITKLHCAPLGRSTNLNMRYPGFLGKLEGTIMLEKNCHTTILLVNQGHYHNVKHGNLQDTVKRLFPGFNFTDSSGINPWAGVAMFFMEDFPNIQKHWKSEQIIQTLSTEDV